MLIVVEVVVSHVHFYICVAVGFVLMCPLGRWVGGCNCQKKENTVRLLLHK